MIGLVVLLALAVAGCSGNAPQAAQPSGRNGSGTPAAARSAAATPETAAVTLKLVGKNIAFDRGTLEADAGKPFVIEFDHQDSGIQHNVAIYRTGPQSLVVRTDLVNGPVVQRLSVAGLPAGTYLYQCDVHPATMSGNLVVK